MVEGDVVVVGPFVDAHLLRHHRNAGRQAIVDVLAVQKMIDRDGGGVPVRDRPDDILRAESSVAAEQDVRNRRLMVTSSTTGMSHLSNAMPKSRSIHGNAFSCRQRSALRRSRNAIRLAGRLKLSAPSSFSTRTFSNVMPVSLPFSCANSLGSRKSRSGCLRAWRLPFPRAGLHLFEARSHDHLHVLAAEPARGAATIHRGVAAAENDDALADLIDMLEINAGQPIDADMDVGGGFLAPGRSRSRPRGAPLPTKIAS